MTGVEFLTNELKQILLDLCSRTGLCESKYLLYVCASFQAFSWFKLKSFFDTSLSNLNLKLTLILALFILPSFLTPKITRQTWRDFPIEPQISSINKSTPDIVCLTGFLFWLHISKIRRVLKNVHTSLRRRVANAEFTTTTFNGRRSSLLPLGPSKLTKRSSLFILSSRVSRRREQYFYTNWVCWHWLAYYLRFWLSPWSGSTLTAVSPPNTSPCLWMENLTQFPNDCMWRFSQLFILQWMDKESCRILAWCLRISFEIKTYLRR